MSAHQTTLQWLGENWIWVLIWIWILGGFGWAADHWRRAVAARREAAEIRHQRHVEIELARRGISPGRQEETHDDLAARWTQAVSAGRKPVALPAAVIPAPPGSRPVSGSPGPCRHERIVPVITDDGELMRWVCANYPRCDAQFHSSVAVYEEQD